MCFCLLIYDKLTVNDVCVNLNSLAELMIRETIQVGIVMGWLLPYWKKSQHLYFVLILLQKK